MTDKISATIAREVVGIGCEGVLVRIANAKGAAR
jgi:hypothetical protein